VPWSTHPQAEADLLMVKSNIEGILSLLGKSHPYDEDLDKLQVA
jgi:hypothetical protein